MGLEGITHSEISQRKTILYDRTHIQSLKNVEAEQNVTQKNRVKWWLAGDGDGEIGRGWSKLQISSYKMNKF